MSFAVRTASMCFKVWCLKALRNQKSGCVQSAGAATPSRIPGQNRQPTRSKKNMAPDALAATSRH